MSPPYTDMPSYFLLCESEAERGRARQSEGEREKFVHQDPEAFG